MVPLRGLEKSERSEAASAVSGKGTALAAFFIFFPASFSPLNLYAMRMCSHLIPNFQAEHFAQVWVVENPKTSLADAERAVIAGQVAFPHNPGVG